MLRLSEPPGPGADRAHTRPASRRRRRSPPSSSVPRTPHRHACSPRPPARPPHAQWDGSSATSPLPWYRASRSPHKTVRSAGCAVAVRLCVPRTPSVAVSSRVAVLACAVPKPAQGPDFGHYARDHARPPLRMVWAMAGIGVCMAANRGCQGSPLARRPGCYRAVGCLPGVTDAGRVAFTSLRVSSRDGRALPRGRRLGDGLVPCRQPHEGSGNGTSREARDGQGGDRDRFSSGRGGAGA